MTPNKPALLLLLAFSAYLHAAWAEDACLTFAKEFHSVAISTSSLDRDYLNKPLPKNMRKLEAGFDAFCRVGGKADIIIQCPKENDPRPQRIIRNAPVIWTDPEGFTVVIISLEDHEKLKGQDMFWASCKEGT
jgi:hypothetical protein